VHIRSRIGRLLCYNVGMNKEAKKKAEAGSRVDRTEVLRVSQRPLVLKQARFAVTAGRDEGREIVLQKTHVSIGTLPENDVVLTDPAVSRRHAVVEETPGGWLLRDRGSTNGTFLDSVRVREAYLKAGAVIRLGTSELVFTPAEERIEKIQSSSDRFGGLIGSSLPMREVFGILERVAPTDITVLLQGETGTGKELAARAIHDQSRRAGKPFVVFDCGAVPPNLIESELFGHEKGAFTDAVKARQGAFELADGGTLFLDEIGELALSLQPKLLRSLDRREVRRVGAEQIVHVDVRVIAATNRDLEAEVKAGTFREDLFYRLSAVSVFLPPLRKRRDDIDRIASHLLTGIAKETGRRVEGLAQEAAEVLRQQPWPGNVRELRNVLVRAAALSESSRIEVKDLFLAPKKTATLEGLSGRTLEEIEKAAIHATLKAADGNKTEAAKALGIAYSTLYEKMKKYGIRV
jgi:DNA-binding NtrC family response regulator